jgi:hypothetical protein
MSELRGLQSGETAHKGQTTTWNLVEQWNKKRTSHKITLDLDLNKEAPVWDIQWTDVQKWFQEVLHLSEPPSLCVKKSSEYSYHVIVPQYGLTFEDQHTLASLFASRFKRQESEVDSSIHTLNRGLRMTYNTKRNGDNRVALPHYPETPKDLSAMIQFLCDTCIFLPPTVELKLPLALSPSFCLTSLLLQSTPTTFSSFYPLG